MAPVPSPPPPPVSQDPIERWVALVVAYPRHVQVETRTFMVERVRRIWGRLGNVIRRHRWCINYRDLNMTPVRLMAWVKRWIRR